MKTRVKTLVSLLLVLAILQLSGAIFNSSEQIVTTAITSTASTPCLTTTAADTNSAQILPAQINQTIPGHIAIAQERAKAVGHVSGRTSLHMELVFNLRNADKFDTCLASLNDPGSPNYRNYLNPTTLQPYLPTPGQKASIISFLSHRGFNVTYGASPLVLEISASANRVESILGVKINQYTIGNSSFYSVDKDPSLPQNLAVLVNGIMGLSNYTFPSPVESPCSGPYCPQGIQVGYSFPSLYSGGHDGTGQKVAIVDAPGDPNMQSAIDTFDSQYGLPSTTLDIRFPDGAPSSYDAGWASEAAMDVEAVHSVAPGAGIILLYDQVSLMNAVDYVATNHLATIVSNSWIYLCTGGGNCNDAQLPSALVSSIDSRLALDSSQGLTILFASGDSGAKPDGTNFGTQFPASDPNVLAIGATNLVLSGCDSTTCSGYSSESGASISGGGYSAHFAEPSWQTSNIGSKSGRAVPDVSMLGFSPNFWVYSTASDKCGAGGSSAGWFGCAGTSLSTPLWSGFLAVALQLKGGGSFGNIASLLYQLANSGSYSSLFHDVTSGSNGYSAGTGWDPVTGWGSPIANNLAAALTQTATVTATTTQISTVYSGTTTLTVTSYTSTSTSTSVIPTLTTIVLIPVTSTVQGTQYQTSIATTTVTSYTGTLTSTSTIPIVTTVTIGPPTSTIQTTQIVTSTGTATVTGVTTTTTTSYTGTDVSTSTTIVVTTITTTSSFLVGPILSIVGLFGVAVWLGLDAGMDRSVTEMILRAGRRCLKS